MACPEKIRFYAHQLTTWNGVNFSVDKIFRNSPVLFSRGVVRRVMASNAAFATPPTHTHASAGTSQNKERKKEGDKKRTLRTRPRVRRTPTSPPPLADRHAARRLLARLDPRLDQSAYGPQRAARAGPGARMSIAGTSSAGARGNHAVEQRLLGQVRALPLG